MVLSIYEWEHKDQYGYLCMYLRIAYLSSLVLLGRTIQFVTRNAVAISYFGYTFILAGKFERDQVISKKGG